MNLERLIQQADEVAYTLNGQPVDSLPALPEYTPLQSGPSASMTQSDSHRAGWWFEEWEGMRVDIEEYYRWPDGGPRSAATLAVKVDVTTR